MTEIRSQSQVLRFGPGLPTARIGERINPTGKPKVQEALRQGNLDWVEELAREQAAAGANALGVNVGLPGTDEAALLVEAVERLSRTGPLPLYIDSSRPEALRAAVQACPSRPLVGSATGEERSFKPLLDYLQDHPAAVVVGLSDEGGVPSRAKDRLRVAERVLAYAAKSGFPREDLVLDCLALTVGADPAAAQETLTCIQELRARFGVSTILGLSNVSFGLPERNIFNRAFAAMAVAAGLSAAIYNPNAPALTRTIMAADVLTARDEFAQAYLEFYRGTPGA